MIPKYNSDIHSLEMIYSNDIPRGQIVERSLSLSAKHLQGIRDEIKTVRMKKTRGPCFSPQRILEIKSRNEWSPSSDNMKFNTPDIIWKLIA